VSSGFEIRRSIFYFSGSAGSYKVQLEIYRYPNFTSHLPTLGDEPEASAGEVDLLMLILDDDDELSGDHRTQLIDWPDLNTIAEADFPCGLASAE